MYGLSKYFIECVEMNQGKNTKNKKNKKTKLVLANDQLEKMYFL